MVAQNNTLTKEVLSISKKGENKTLNTQKNIINHYLRNMRSCVKCGEYIPYMNEEEEEELKELGAFTCSECINKEMDAQQIINESELSEQDQADLNLRKVVGK